MKLQSETRIYLISPGATGPQTTSHSEDFANLLRLVKAAVAAEIDLIQLREKQLSARVLYELAHAAAQITRGSRSGLLINDRADIAAATGADGVHLTTGSLSPGVIRRAFGERFLIGVSTHSLTEARNARDQDADFAVLGPVFQTSSKQKYGEPLGVDEFRSITSELAPFPIFALGGIDLNKVADCVKAGAAGVAAITLLNDPARLRTIVGEIKSRFV